MPTGEPGQYSTPPEPDTPPAAPPHVLLVDRMDAAERALGLLVEMHNKLAADVSAELGL